MIVDSDCAAAVAERSRAFEASYARGDAAALVESYFVPDAHLPLASPPGGTAPVRGRTALVAMFGAMFADVPTISLETIELVPSQDLAYELGRAHLTLADGTRVIGRYAVCWKRTEIGWRAQIDFFTDDGWPD